MGIISELEAMDRVVCVEHGGLKVNVQLFVNYEQYRGHHYWTEETNIASDAIDPVLARLGLEFFDSSIDDDHHETMIYAPMLTAPEGIPESIWQLARGTSIDDLAVLRDWAIENKHPIVELLEEA